jgi:hypothetical protein
LYAQIHDVATIRSYLLSMKIWWTMVAGMLGSSACSSQTSEAPNMESQGLSMTPYACVTMRTPDAASTVLLDGSGHVVVSGTMRADLVGTTKALDEEQDADVTLVFNGNHDVSTLGSGTTARQAGLKLKERDPCNLIYVMYNINPFLPDSDHAGNDELSVKVKRNDGGSTSADCPGASGYHVVKSFKIANALQNYAGTVHLNVSVRPPLADGVYNLILSAWVNDTKILNAVAVDLDSLPAAQQPDWGGVVGLRTDNVNVDYGFVTPAPPAAVIARDDPAWATDCGSRQSD